VKHKHSHLTLDAIELKAPSKRLSKSPSFRPTALIVVQTVKTAGSLSTSQDFCSMGEAQLAAFKEASIATIRNLACPEDSNDSSCTAEITSACGVGSRRELSTHRVLRSAIAWQLEYEVVNTFICESATCSSASDLASAASVSSSVSTTMRNSMSNGLFISLLSAALLQTAAFNDAAIVTCLVMWGNTEAKPVTEIGSAVTGTGKFYPDWENGSGTCLEDGNEPQYMAQGATMWLSDSLIECCLQFFQVSYIDVCSWLAIALNHFHC
jgi:hypothetical protein